ncbi:hypothetical protein H4S01_002335 [Coemansia sp. RSA 2610]|nr:hypothetical protein H4S01_002335 [Coemansia sp. RSA 2610]
MASNRSVEDLAALYRQGHNTLGFLKLARELGSMERRVVSSIMYLEAERDASDKKPPLFKRKFSPLQQRVHLETQGSFDQAVANLARDLDIILPPYQTKRSLEWIPRLNHLYKNDSNWGRTLRQHD